VVSQEKAWGQQYDVDLFEARQLTFHWCKILPLAAEVIAEIDVDLVALTVEKGFGKPGKQTVIRETLPNGFSATCKLQMQTKGRIPVRSRATSSSRQYLKGGDDEGGHRASSSYNSSRRQRVHSYLHSHQHSPQHSHQHSRSSRHHGHDAVVSGSGGGGSSSNRAGDSSGGCDGGGAIDSQPSFGVPLENVPTLASNLPVVVVGCVTELEKRGLHEPEVYGALFCRIFSQDTCCVQLTMR
jgi:hypothetical protein